MKLANVVRKLVEALGCDEKELNFRPAYGENRNVVMETLSPLHLFAKFPNASPRHVSREKALYRLLSGRHLSPRLWTRDGYHGDLLISEPIAGITLENALVNVRLRDFETVLDDTWTNLVAIQHDEHLSNWLISEVVNWVGPYARDFSPRVSLVKMDTAWDALLPMESGNRVVVHGSLSPNNLIVVCGRRAGQDTLAGILDWEGCRVAHIGFDEAVLMFSLACDAPRCAEIWADMVSGQDSLRADCAIQLAWIWAMRRCRSDGYHLPDNRVSIDELMSRLLGVKISFPHHFSGCPTN